MRNYIIISPESWADIKDIYLHLNSYWFRGQNNSSFEIQSSIERLVNKSNIPYVHLDAREKDIINYIKKKRHLLNIQIPPEEDNIGWLSIARHHGGPTRLVDFTYSPYIATFFALEKKTNEAAVWALGSTPPLFWLMENKPNTPKQFYGYEHNEYLYKVGNEIFNEPSSAQRYFLQERNESQKFVINVEPVDYTNRISNQQGFFMMQSNLNIPFMDNLFSTYKIERENYINVKNYQELLELKQFDESPINIFKILINGELRNEILQSLANMNVRHSVLYPDIEGFLKELEFKLESNYM